MRSVPSGLVVVCLHMTAGSDCVNFYDMTLWSCSFQHAPLESSSFYNNTTSTTTNNNKEANIIQCADCPADFTYLSTVNGGCYKVVTRNLSNSDAGLNCRAIHKDAHLLVINDAAEQSAVAGMLESVSSLYHSSFWLLCNICHNKATEALHHHYLHHYHHRRLPMRLLQPRS